MFFSLVWTEFLCACSGSLRDAEVRWQGEGEGNRKWDGEDGSGSVAARKSAPVGPRLKEELFSEETVRHGEMWKCCICMGKWGPQIISLSINVNVTSFKYARTLLSQVDAM